MTLIFGIAFLSVSESPAVSPNGFYPSIAFNHILMSMPRITLPSIFFINSNILFAISLQTDLLERADLKDIDIDYESSLFMNKRKPFRYLPSHNKSIESRKNIPPGYDIAVDVDSSGRKVTIYEQLSDMELSYPYDLDMDTYLAIRKKRMQNAMWDSLVTDYDIMAALSGYDLAKMLSQGTGVTIPVPPNVVMSIFGKPEISIDVTGQVNLRMGWRFDSQNHGTVSAFGQTQSSPVFEQDINVNVTGKIGDKLTLGTDWNTRNQFEYKNKFKIGYEGEDDDIIKLIEVGNVSLPLQSSLIGGGQALFGVRADFQFGPLFLKTIVSQRRGERKFIDVRGGVSKMPFSLRAYDYARNHFFLDTVYKQIYNDYFQYSTPVLPNTPSANYNRIKEIEVWESAKSFVANSGLHSPAICIDDLTPLQMKNPNSSQNQYGPNVTTRATIAGKVERGNFVRLDSHQYTVDYNLGTLAIHNLRPDRTYAVSYRTEGTELENWDDWYHGTLTTASGQTDTLVLKLIFRQNMQPGFETIWDRQMKNIFSINATNVDVNETNIGIWYYNQNNDSTDVLEGAPDKLVTIMKVDQVNNSTGNIPPDGQFDLKPPFFDSYRGEITFPNIEPFRDGINKYFEAQGIPQLAQQYTFDAVYDTTYDVARKDTRKDRFVISGEVSGKSSNTINLGAFSLTPGSVKVSLDGRVLREYEDYVIDYYSGQLKLRNPRAMMPNANLKIEYESQDIFNVSTKTLMGLRADYILYNSRRLDANIGFTLMYYDQSAIIDRVRLGEEPVSNTMMGFDASMQWDMPWVTDILDKLPFYDTKAPSTFTAKGEIAMIMPEPNKRYSDVASDNGEPVVYIDDFEGSQRYISLGLSPTQWTHSSQPVDTNIAETEQERADFRGKTFWWQYFLPRVPITDVYPKRQIVQGRSHLRPMHINFTPFERGIYNANPAMRDSTNPHFDPDSSRTFLTDNQHRIWGGMMRLLSSFNTNFDNENIEFIEVMMRLENYTPGETRMFIDLGQISEDVIPNGLLNTEDGFTQANPLPNGIIDVGEDVGIDQIDNTKEQEPDSYYPWPLYLESDPSKDDYAFNFARNDNDRDPVDFVSYNNFEGNSRVSEMGQFPDTEVLNKNNGETIVTDNSYFTYEIYMNPNPENNDQIVGGNEETGWFLYRIPLRNPVSRTGNPLFSNIQYVRVWFKGAPIKLSIAEWQLVGSHWQRISNIQSGVAPNDSVMQVSFVNVEENDGSPDYYTMPPGVRAPRQLNNPDPNQDIRLNEQSLALNVRNLRYGEERMAVRYFLPQDIFNYKELKFFVHGDGTMPAALEDEAVPKAYAFLRFGTDSSNYYEYRQPLLRGWQDIRIILSELTAVKQLRDSLGRFQRMEFPVPGDPLAVFAVRGNPILTRVQFFGFGIANPADRYPNELTTTIWVDELRLIKPERANDWAAVADVDFKLADLATVHANINHMKPNFHKLEERFGNRKNSTTWSVSVQGNLEKFAPKSFKQMKLPITYTHSEFVEDPLYQANNDIFLDEASNAAYNQAIREGKTEEQAQKMYDSIKTSSQTVKIQDSWGLTGVRLGIPVDHWLVSETVNKVTLGYTYSQEWERSPVVAERFRWMWRLTTEYATNIPELLSLRPFSWIESIPLFSTYSGTKLNFLPSAFAVNLNMTRSRTTEQSRFLTYPSPVFRDFSAERGFEFSWKFSENGFLNPLLDYSINTRSTLVPMELDENGRQRTGSELLKKIFFNDGIINLGDDIQHTQSVTLNFTPQLPLGSWSRFFENKGSYTVVYDWQNPLQPDPRIHNVAKSARYNANISFNFGFRLKAMADSWWGIAPNSKSPTRTPGDSASRSSGSSFLSGMGQVMKTIFLDFEKIDIIFNQNNSSINPGVFGGNGLTNFWARGMTFRPSDMIWGPSMAYQFGLVSNPHGGFNFESQDQFPFFSISSFPGLRPQNAVLQDNYTQRTNLEARTTRPLWEGAKLDLNWRTEKSYNRNQTVITDSLGVPTFTNIFATETFSRTYLTLPSVFGINFFDNNIENVISLYEQKKSEIDTTGMDPVDKSMLYQSALSESFHDGMEAFSFLGGAIGKFLPAINWSITWEGLEKWDIFDGLAKRIRIEHKYTSRYNETAQTTDNGRAVSNQQIQYGFQPLVGVNMTFDKERLGGILTAQLRLITQNSYQLNTSNKSMIASTENTKLELQASYTMDEFKFPLLGIDLKNEFELSFLGSYNKSRRARFIATGADDVNNPDEGNTLDGNTQIVVEPRASYSLSRIVRASAFVRYEGTITEGASNP